MVRGILDEEGNVKTVAMTTMTTLPDDNDGSGGGNATDSRMDKSSDTATAPGPDEPSSSSSLSVRPAGGKVIQADNGARGGRTTYVGATHFMAMLDDVGCCFLFVFILFLNPNLTKYICTASTCPNYFPTRVFVRSSWLADNISKYRSKISKAISTKTPESRAKSRLPISQCPRWTPLLCLARRVAVWPCRVWSGSATARCALCGIDNNCSTCFHQSISQTDLLCGTSHPERLLYVCMGRGGPFFPILSMTWFSLTDVPRYVYRYRPQAVF